MIKLRNLLCTSLAAVLALIASSGASVCCPFIGYQPELPKKE
ncbi:MAG: cyclic lactone autoinducer peptide [Syntrophomonadaceae bacterium]|nr:cyclic lactone autoinducer peptide [Syntrophomonadaceae bacterium]